MRKLNAKDIKHLCKSLPSHPVPVLSIFFNFLYPKTINKRGFYYILTMEDNISFADFLWGWAPQEFAVIGSLSGRLGGVSSIRFHRISNSDRRPTLSLLIYLSGQSCNTYYHPSTNRLPSGGNFHFQFSHSHSNRRHCKIHFRRPSEER